ncbi:MAG: copper chaperone PCu(A)C [bacterium]
MKSILKLASLLVVLLALPAVAHEGIHIHDPYARVIGPSGVVFFMIDNQEHVDDTLLSVTSTTATAMLMNDTADANGVMKMSMVPDGFVVKAGQTRLLTNVSDHVMLSAFTSKPKPGDTIEIILTFRNVGDVKLTVPVDNARRSDPTMGPTQYDAKSAAMH